MNNKHPDRNRDDSFFAVDKTEIYCLNEYYFLRPDFLLKLGKNSQYLDLFQNMIPN